MFEKICDLSDLWTIVCEGSPFVLFSVCVSLLFCGCIVAFYSFSECCYFVGWKVVVVSYLKYGLPFYCPIFFIQR